ncbi:MAG: hypothetical protein CM1200mP36_11380 [Gammaproteobacteria bacterium]|nr:MAG: hypothetical protein CM1200mP36_11380 [Gammaproteobacteria bacterium]
MGGTSTDVCLVEDGEPGLTSQTEIGGLPVRTPLFDIVSIGAGWVALFGLTKAVCCASGRRAPELIRGLPARVAAAIGRLSPTPTLSRDHPPRGLPRWRNGGHALASHRVFGK